jgi:hypothetical protein
VAAKKLAVQLSLAGGGGITDTDAIESFAERSCRYPNFNSRCRAEQLKNKEYIGMPILQNKVAEAERMKMAQAMMSPQQGQQAVYF